MLVAVLQLWHASTLTPGEQTGQRSSPLLMLALCSCHCPQSLVGRYPRSSGSSVKLWATCIYIYIYTYIYIYIHIHIYIYIYIYI